MILFISSFCWSRRALREFWAHVGTFIFATSVIATGAVAQPVTQQEMDGLDLREVDQLLAEIRQQVDLVRFGSNNLTSGGATAPTTTTVTSTAPVGQSDLRFRGNALCFADNPEGLTTPVALDSYLDTVEGTFGSALAILGSFNDLQSTAGATGCKDFMRGMLDDVELSLASLERNALNSLVLHLQECWVDEEVATAPGDPYDIDARHARVRQFRTSFTNSLRRLAEAEAWCAS